jgi:hypothetical protein
MPFSNASMEGVMGPRVGEDDVGPPLEAACGRIPAFPMALKTLYGAAGRAWRVVDHLRISKVCDIKGLAKALRLWRAA